MAGLIRLTHPFPSLLVSLTTGVLAQVAAGSVATSARLGVAMLGLQVSIGALNDLVDAPRDAVTKPGKPIPRGAASPAEARVIAGAGLLAAVALIIPSGAGALLVLAACATCGYAYDLRLSRTAVSWLPLAVALPLVPVFAWVGATGGVPAALVPTVPAGALAGAGLALANALADLERDRSAGAATAAVRLGPRRTWLVGSALLLGAVGIIVAARPGGFVGAGAPMGATFSTLAGTAALLLGMGLAARGLDAGPDPHLGPPLGPDRGETVERGLAGGGGAQRRERAWELEAIGIALVAAGWLASLATG